MRVHLIDGTYELFRAHFSKRPSHEGPGGVPLKATVGVAASLIALLHDPVEAPTHVAIAFDNPIESFRNDLFDGYKTGEGVPEELAAQFDRVEEAAHALGIRVWSMRDHEADDALATGAARLRDEVEQVRILTPDKDLAQCVRGQRVVQVDRRDGKILDEPAVVAKHGVAPASIPDLLALIGDTADGIPGLPGWGAVSASTVLREYGHLEAIPSDARAWKVKPRGAEKLAAVLEARRADALLYRKLATLIEDAPIAATLEEVSFGGIPRDAFHAWCDRNLVTHLRERPTRWR
jgi:5'-3' exonuclease